jgi:hypothetical protein
LVDSGHFAVKGSLDEISEHIKRFYKQRVGACIKMRCDVGSAGRHTPAKASTKLSSAPHVECRPRSARRGT